MPNAALPLDLAALAIGYPGLKANVASSFVDAGAVCLEHNGHSHGAILIGYGDCKKKKWELLWPYTDEQTRRTWDDIPEATEKGACCIAILVAQQHTGHSVLSRSRKQTGFDYWLGDEDEYPFQGKARLEISGILKGNDSVIKQRVKEKLQQTNQSDDTMLPAYVVVIEFSKPASYLVKK